MALAQADHILDRWGMIQSPSRAVVDKKKQGQVGF